MDSKWELSEPETGQWMGCQEEYPLVAESLLRLLRLREAQEVSNLLGCDDSNKLHTVKGRIEMVRSLSGMILDLKEQR